VHGGDVELGEAEPARDIHRGDDRLVGGTRIGADGDRAAIRAGLLENCRPQRVGLELMSVRSFTR